MAFRSTVTSSLFVLMRVLLFVAVSAQAIAEIERRVDYHHKWCNKNAIQINQGPTLPLPNGIPTYTVEIANTCVSGCNISHIHVDCGRFSSAILINPRIFKRLSYNDCLVNDGNPLRNGAILSFKYATTYPCPLSVSSVVCH